MRAAGGGVPAAHWASYPHPAGPSDAAGLSVAPALLTGPASVTVTPGLMAMAGMRTLYIRTAAVAATSIHASLAPAASRVTVQTLIPPAGLVMLPAYPAITEWISTFYEKEVQGEATG